MMGSRCGHEANRAALQVFACFQLVVTMKSPQKPSFTTDHSADAYPSDPLTLAVSLRVSLLSSARIARYFDIASVRIFAR